MIELCDKVKIKKYFDLLYFRIHLQLFNNTSNNYQILITKQ